MAKQQSTALVTTAPVFGPLTCADDVGLEGEALVRRYLLWDAQGGRRDLLGAPFDLALAREVHQQLVSGVDLAFAGVDAGWRIVPGTRIERLIHSPWLEGFDLPTTAFQLPATEKAFADAFAARTGIGINHTDLFERVYRFTPQALGNVAMQVRNSEPAPWPTFRLLLSREYKLLEARGLPALLTLPPGTARGFDRPALDGFKLLDEIEREALIGMDLTRLGSVGTLAELRHMLANDSSAQLRARIAGSPDLRRLLAYALVQTDLLAAFDTSHRLLGPEHAEHPSSWFTAARIGKVTATTGDVAAMLGERGSVAREILLTETFVSPTDGRTNPLNNAAATWWGLDNLVLNRVARVMLGREYAGGTRGIPGAGPAVTLEDRSSLAPVILRHVSPIDATRVGKRAVAHQTARDGTTQASMANVQKQAAGYAKYILPKAGHLGSAPGYSGQAWSHRFADARFWRMVFGKDRTLFVLFRLSHAEAAALNNALRRVHQLFEAAFGQHASVEVAARAACDLASGVNAISTNPRLVVALRELLDILGDMGVKRPEDFRQAKPRLIMGSDTFLKARVRKGVPSAADSRREGTPRAKRAGGRLARNWQANPTKT